MVWQVGFTVRDEEIDDVELQWEDGGKRIRGSQGFAHGEQPYYKDQASWWYEGEVGTWGNGRSQRYKSVCRAWTGLAERA